jgi:hypothetical protein
LPLEIGFTPAQQGQAGLDSQMSRAILRRAPCSVTLSAVMSLTRAFRRTVTPSFAKLSAARREIGRMGQRDALGALDEDRAHLRRIDPAKVAA